MALTISNGGGRIIYINRTINPLRRHVILFPTSTSTTQTSSRTRTLLVVSAAKKLSSRTGRFDSKNRRTGNTTTTEEDQEQKVQQEQTTSFEIGDNSSVVNNNMVENVGVSVDDGLVLPDLPGEKADFWEGPQWDAFGFFMQYMWAFGVVFALVACGIAVVTYNEGAADFKETPAYKESVQSRELLEGPEASNSDVFESNPTEVAPSLD